MLSGGEQNRLIQAHMGLAKAIATEYRGRSVPFEDLLSEAMTALVLTARSYKPNGAKFSSVAHTRIDGALRDLVQRWQEMDGQGVTLDDLERTYEWATWSMPPYEAWLRLPFTVEELAELGETLAERAIKLQIALRFLTRRDRRMVEALLRGDSVASIARDNHVSYYRAGRVVLKRTLRRLDQITARMQSGSGRASTSPHRQSAARLPAPAPS